MLWNPFDPGVPLILLLRTTAATRKRLWSIGLLLGSAESSPWCVSGGAVWWGHRMYDWFHMMDSNIQPHLRRSSRVSAFWGTCKTQGGHQLPPHTGWLKALVRSFARKHDLQVALQVAGDLSQALCHAQGIGLSWVGPLKAVVSLIDMDSLLMRPLCPGTYARNREVDWGATTAEDVCVAEWGATAGEMGGGLVRKKNKISSQVLYLWDGSSTHWDE